MKAISRNPIRGFKVSKGRARVTYFTPEIEQALLKNSKPALASAIKVLIRTGAMLRAVQNGGGGRPKMVALVR